MPLGAILGSLTQLPLTAALVKAHPILGESWPAFAEGNFSTTVGKKVTGVSKLRRPSVYTQAIVVAAL